MEAVLYKNAEARCPFGQIPDSRHWHWHNQNMLATDENNHGHNLAQSKLHWIPALSLLLRRIVLSADQHVRDLRVLTTSLPL